MDRYRVAATHKKTNGKEGGVKAMIGFHKALLAMRMPWPLWLAVLVAVNLGGGLVFIGTIEGRLVLAALALGVLIQTVVFGRLGFVRLLGIGHIGWLPLVPWLLTRLDAAGPPSVFGYWIAAVIVVDSLSLIIDVVDVIRYLRGDRKPTVAAIDK